jgi:hypothetical protein
MKGYFLLLISFAVLTTMVAVLVVDVLSEKGGHDRETRAKRVPFASKEMSREQYIRYLLRTEKHDDPELWVRIEAVKQLKNWPE